MKPYVDGFILPVPTAKLKEYKKMAEKAAKIWKEYGVLDYKECVVEDTTAPMGISFPKGIQVKRNETVIFSWIVYASKAHRNKVNRLIMKDPRMGEICGDPMPFSADRMLYSGFKILVSS